MYFCHQWQFVHLGSGDGTAGGTDTCSHYSCILFLLIYNTPLISTLFLCSLRSRIYLSFLPFPPHLYSPSCCLLSFCPPLIVPPSHCTPVTLSPSHFLPPLFGRLDWLKDNETSQVVLLAPIKSVLPMHPVPNTSPPSPTPLMDNVYSLLVSANLHVFIRLPLVPWWRNFNCHLIVLWRGLWTMCDQIWLSMGLRCHHYQVCVRTIFMITIHVITMSQPLTIITHFSTCSTCIHLHLHLDRTYP